MSFHVSPPVDEIEDLLSAQIPISKGWELDSFTFNDGQLEDADTLKACLRMFIDMQFLVNFDIDYRCLCKWLLSVKKNYRPVTYHNWRHAFNVAQTMFVMLNNENGILRDLLGEEEKLALFVGEREER